MGRFAYMKARIEDMEFEKEHVPRPPAIKQILGWELWTAPPFICYGSKVNDVAFLQRVTLTQRNLKVWRKI